jgi:hypothetical protein
MFAGWVGLQADAEHQFVVVDLLGQEVEVAVVGGEGGSGWLGGDWLGWQLAVLADEGGRTEAPELRVGRAASSSIEAPAGQFL